MKDKAAAPAAAARFYNIASDLAEYGLGQSIHMSQGLLGMTWRESEVAHEAMIAGMLRLKPGMHALDCGCGIGGPMRTVAKQSGARVTGITISEHQVQRLRDINAKLGIPAKIADVVHGNYLQMPFPDSSFDAAWAIESTCYAPSLQAVYREVYRVLRPGAIFLSNEFLLGPGFSRSNPRHVHVIAELCRRSGLPELRTVAEAEAAGSEVGFEILSSVDMVAATSRLSRPWWQRYVELRTSARISKVVIGLLDLIRVLPTGLRTVHSDLCVLNEFLIESGRDNLIVPMHFILFRKT